VLLRVVLVAVALAAAIAVAGPLAIRMREPDASGVLPPGVPGRLLAVGGHRVHVVERGSGPPLLLVHGFGASTFDYEEQVLEPLARSHRAIAVDLYGFGWSERSDEFTYGWPLWSEQLAGTLDALGVERAAIAGHSMGGAAAAVFAVRHPARVERLVLADALYPLEPDEIPLVFRGLRTPVLGELMLGLVADTSPPGFSDAYYQRARPWHRIAGTRRGFLDYVRDPSRRAEMGAAYPQIAAPTLILHGTADANVPYGAMQRVAPAIRGARVVTLEGGGHFVLRDAPETFVREVEAFLRE
jgi:pimeloyl-ACP methyl ester carboxylesterase